MKAKRFTFFILFCLVFSQIAPNLAFAGVDVTAPTFESISVDKKSVKAGETVKVQVKATDSGSGLEPYLFVYYTSPITEKEISVYLPYNSHTKMYEGSLTLTDSMESGKWEVSYFYLRDQVSNYKRVGGPLENGSFTLTGTSADVTAPTFESISVDKKSVKAGETVKVQVKATDSGSGLEPYLFVYYTSPITEKEISVYLPYNSDTKMYEGSLTLTDSMESGKWEVSYFYLRDQVSNYKRVGGPLENGSFTLTGTSADVTAPTFESISVDKKSVKAGETVKVQVKATDSGSGLEPYLFVYYTSPITEKEISVYLPYNSDTKMYEGSLTLTNSMEPGKWEVSYFYLRDQVSNYKRIGGPLEGASFTFQGEDNVKPTFKSIQVDQETIEANSYNRITVKAADDTLVKSVVVKYANPNSKTIESVELSKEEDQETFSGDGWFGESGDWKAASVDITDINGNTLTVTKGLENGTFKVLPPIESIGHRIVTGNETWYSEVINDDVYIGPNAVLTVNGNVTINGNVYVLGGLRSYGGLRVTGTVHAKRFLFSSGYYSYLNNGDVIVSGSNSLYGMTASNYPLADVPFKLNNTPLNAKDNKVNLEGSTVPVVDVYLNNKPLSLNSNGTFRLNGYDVTNQKELTFKFVDVFGHTTTKTYKVYGTEPVQTPKVNEISDKDVKITGVAGSEVKVTAKLGTKTYTGTANAKGQFTISIPKQKAGTSIKIKAKDEAGNSSVEVSLTVKDKTPPALPTVQPVTNEDTVISGTSEAGSLVYIKSGSTVLARKVADSKGHYEVKIPLQKAGTKLSVIAKDNAGNYSKYAYVTVSEVDRTAPEKPAVNPVTDQDTMVTGTSEPGSTATVKIGSKVYSSVVQKDSSFKVTIDKQKANTSITITATDAANNTSEPTVVKVEDRTRPDAPTLNAVTNEDVKVTGKAEPNSLVYVKKGSSIIGRGKTNARGQFSVAIPKQKEKLKISVVVKDTAGNYSPYAYTTVVKKEATPPAAPNVNEVSDLDTKVSGTGQPNTIITVKASAKEYKGTTRADGHFEVTIDKQKAGTNLIITSTNQEGASSAEVKKIVEDKTPPAIFTINEITNEDAKITGKAEAGSTVYAKVGSTIIGKRLADVNGNFTVIIPKQKVSTKINLVARDSAGNYSKYTSKIVSQKRPQAPNVNMIKAIDKKVTGTAEGNSLVYVKVGSTIIGRGKTDTTGHFTVAVPAQTSGTKVSVVIKNSKGLYSSYTSKVVQ
ncbi:Ig-like domain-containing protein [Priestia flexa]|uniref:Ig-like domain-containing protein n=1 Tax=Priestia flexa TaxID=86664 RepID=UPI001C93C53F|nr:Ig-like domain-containing protein [Priestia flexa]MBY6085965.1 hypothetical protein [Priestia flexa]